MIPEGKCACKGTNLDRFLQPIILSILNKEACSGYTVVKQISRYATFEQAGADPTGVYRYLKIMRYKGMIEKLAEGAEADEAERETACFHITAKGVECLEEWKVTLGNYMAQIGVLLEQLGT